MTPEQEIAGLKNICQAWRKDCDRYANGLMAVRKSAMQNYDVSDYESDRWLDLISQINAILAFDNQCDVCGDHHEGETPRACETGDGI
jgi:hypothetical protein